MKLFTFDYRINLQQLHSLQIMVFVNAIIAGDDKVH